MNIKLSYHWAAAALLAIATGCSNDNITPETKPDSGKPETTQVSFIAGNEGTRTSLNYGSGDFYWEDGDRIFVEDDDHTFHANSNNVSGTQVSHFKFMMPGKYAASEYLVYYPGKNGNNNHVTISAEQTQTKPDNTLHFGTSGDCGTGKATRQTNGQYTFKLNHSAAYLCFKPTFDHPLASTYVTKIEVTADQPIAGSSYTLGTDGKLTGTGSSTTITLNLKGTGSYAKGFPMQNDATGKKCAAGRMFMVMMPGKYKLTVKYYVTDTETQVSGVITKKFPAFEYGANDYYDIPSALNIKYYGDDYYTWDAKKDYWYGHKNDQPKKIGIQKSNYPTSADADRWFNPAKFPAKASNTAKNCPNVNEIFWYCLKGDPHWDDTTLWTVWQHLYTGGMWFKKASVIAKENGEANAAALKSKSPGGKDRTKSPGVFETPPNNTSITHKVPDDRSKYFFLPALGNYAAGELKEFRTYGFYWTSTPLPSNYYGDGKSYNLAFNNHDVVVSNTSDRNNGYRLWTSE